MHSPGPLDLGKLRPTHSACYHLASVSDAQLLEMTPLLGRNSKIHNFPSTASVVSPLQGAGRSCHLHTHPPGQCHGEQSVTKGHGFRGFNN